MRILQFSCPTNLPVKTTANRAVPYSENDQPDQASMIMTECKCDLPRLFYSDTFLAHFHARVRSKRPDPLVGSCD
ncbi:hypothetical protein RB7748 [Rhodopirellula baltica SH 1]|uniref:Uncharacterized protein n=1 Tax=Rhodopirellula baltica (strain DSM 10527 / NCIMB 13988 / SH1) TaxID=243090 RepID=Q7UN68_RHOBA|nr:hypothetical protein RB7748 [Rhodopirellula baltica SH 1]